MVCWDVMLMYNHRRSGFTIVELLIVVVVIAILAAISVVAYAGFQNRANDSAVQSDINNFAKKILLYYAEHGEYPEGNNTNAPEGIGRFPLAQGSYRTDAANFYYCTGTVAGQPAFAVGAASKSHNAFYYSSLNGGLQPYTGAQGSMVGYCTGMLPGIESGYTRTYGFASTTQTWFSWTQ